MKSLTAKVAAVLGHKRFFWFVVVLFVVEAAWIAVSAAYPQAFDENFHFGLIKVYSHYWLPFLSSQPPDGNAFGAVAHDPSYLYHFLMSFPYRLLALVTHNQPAQIVALRLLNVAFFAGGLILFRQVLARAKVSAAFTNVALLVLALIPIVPQMAGQINYDNLLFLLVAWICLTAFQFLDELRAHRPTARTLLTLVITCLFTGLVKYAFLPIFLGLAIFVAVCAYRQFRGHLTDLWQHLARSFVEQSKYAKVILAGLLVLSLGMFVQRDGVNLVKYHAIQPDCGQILSKQDCSAYSVWRANYIDHNRLAAGTKTLVHNPLWYLGEWFYWMWYRLFFAITGPPRFTNYPPLPLPAAAGGVVTLLSTAAIAIWWRRIFRHNVYLSFLFTISLVYLLVLLVQGVVTYRYTAVLENMNGRYLVPVLLPLAAVAGRALSLALRRLPLVRALAAVIVLVCFLDGGGLLTFLARSDSAWDWQNTAVVRVNNAARDAVNPLVWNRSKTYKSKLWFFD